jgi:hypothetical protein
VAPGGFRSSYSESGPVKRMAEVAIGQQGSLGCGQGIRHTSPIQLRVESGCEHRGPGIRDRPESGYDFASPRSEERGGQRGIVLTR